VGGFIDVFMFCQKLFRGTFSVLRWLCSSRRRFLGDMADERKTVSVFIRDMASSDGKYHSVTPFGKQQEWQNCSVVARGDVEAASEFLNLLGQVGKASNIAWPQINSHWDTWFEPSVCVGGSFKTDKAFELCTPAFVRRERHGFIALVDNQEFLADSRYDYGIIYRGRHPSGNSCLVLFGDGVAGTVAAGVYLRRNALYLARLYGSRPFAAIVRVGWRDGKDSGVIAWLSPAAPLAPWLHPVTWWRHRKFIGSRRSIRPQLNQDIGCQPREPDTGSSSGSGPSGPPGSGSTFTTRRPDTGSGS